MAMIKVPILGNNSLVFTVVRQNDNICSNKTTRFFFNFPLKKEVRIRCQMSLAGGGGGGGGTSNSAGEDVRTMGSNRDGVGGASTRRRIVEDYNTAMKRMMRNPYEYHHDLGMNYSHIIENLIVGSQPQKPEDIIHLKEEENVAYILCLQQNSDIEYWGIDFEAIIKKCRDVGIHHMRTPARDFDPDSLRIGLPKAVSALEWAMSEGKGRVYVHCTAGLGRAPAVAIAYMFWFSGMNLDSAYDTLTSKRSCGPSKRSIRGATYDLAKNDPWKKEQFDDLPETAFGNVSDWERSLIQERVRGLRGY